MAGVTKLTPEVQVKIVESLKVGSYMETAAEAAGVTRKTVYNWLQRGKAARDRMESGDNTEIDDPLYLRFLEAAEKALAEAEQRNLLIIANAARSDWKAAAWSLERRYPLKWGRRERLEVEGNMTEKIIREEKVIQERIAADPESVELLKQLYRRQAAIDNPLIANQKN